MKPALLLLLFICLSFAQTTRFTVRNLEVKGNVRTDASTIRINSGLYIGKQFTVSDVNEAIKNLWTLKQWSNISIDAAEISDNLEVDLIINVEEHPRVNRYVYKGNDELDEDDLNDITGLYRGKIYTPYQVFLMKRKILEKYVEDGYLLATVDVDTTILPKNKINLTFNIDEGAEVEVERIRVFGNTSLEVDDITDAMDETSENGFLGFGGSFARKDYDTDLDLVSSFIKNQGFKDGGVVKDSIYYSADNTEMYIDIHVKEGKRYYFGDVIFQGNDKIPDSEFKNSIELKKGAPYSEEKFSEAKQKLTQLYYDIGHLYAGIAPREELIGNDTISVRYDITEGNVVRIRGINIEGNSKTREKVIRRNIKIYPGQKFSQSAIQQAMGDINALNYFSEVLPDVKQLPGNNDYIDLDFSVKEKSTDQANASVGYSERDGMIGSVGLTFNNFAMSEPFKEGGGQTLGINAQFGGVTNVYSLNFTEPYLNDTPTLIGGSVYYSRTRRNDGNSTQYNPNSQRGFSPYDEDRQSIRLTVGRHFRRPDPFFSGSLSIEYSRSKLSNVIDAYNQPGSYLSIIEGKDIRSTTFSASITRNSKNSQEFPTNGSLYSFTTEINFGDKNYFKSIFKNEVYFPIFGNVIFFGSTKVGALGQFGDENLILPNDRFHMGGNGMSYATESLRGYDDRTVGDNDVIDIEYGRSILGGDAMFKFAAELRMQLVPNPTIFGLLFIEGGNVWKDTRDFNIYDLKRSIGVGVRLFMPLVGIIGVDYGYPFDKFENIFSTKTNPTWQVHFQFGKF